MSTIDKAIDRALEKAGAKENVPLRERLRKLLIERRVDYIPHDAGITGKRLGNGVYGEVDLIQYKGKLYARKRSRQPRNDYRRGILDEGLKLTDIAQTHPNIQRLFFIDLQTLGIVLGYCTNGSLDVYVSSERVKYTLLDVFNWAYQLADALSFLHANKIIHRDVKMQNILLKDNHKSLVLTDYGTATNMGKSCMTQEVGTPITMAPEVCIGELYAEECDIYSWSIVFWQLLTKDLLPYGRNGKGFLVDVVHKKLRPPKLANCPELILALLYRSWHSNRNERPKLSFIKKVLRLVIRALPKENECYKPETAEQLRHQWVDEFHLDPKYLPNEPRLNNEQSKNIYQGHLAAIQRIIGIEKEIISLEEKLAKYSKYQSLRTENQKLQEQIDELSAETKT